MPDRCDEQKLLNLSYINGFTIQCSKTTRILYELVILEHSTALLPDWHLNLTSSRFLQIFFILLFVIFFIYRSYPVKRYSFLATNALDQMISLDNRFSVQNRIVLFFVNAMKQGATTQGNSNQSDYVTFHRTLQKNYNLLDKE